MRSRWHNAPNYMPNLPTYPLSCYLPTLSDDTIHPALDLSVFQAMRIDQKREYARYSQKLALLDPGIPSDYRCFFSGLYFRENGW